MQTTKQNRTALVEGATGIVGGNLAPHLHRKGWKVYGVSRKPRVTTDEMIPVTADLFDLHALTLALAEVNPDHVFISSWSRQESEEKRGRERSNDS